MATLNIFVALYRKSVVISPNFLFKIILLQARKLLKFGKELEQKQQKPEAKLESSKI